jgi:hypothetical protein
MAYPSQTRIEKLHSQGGEQEDMAWFAQDAKKRMKKDGEERDDDGDDEITTQEGRAHLRTWPG